mgnify:CR=1 FL=1
MIQAAVIWMDEHIIATVTLDETKALGIVEPLDDTLFTSGHLFFPF